MPLDGLDRELAELVSHREGDGQPPECSVCGYVAGRLLRVRAQYVDTPAELPERPMCLGCALDWPGAIERWDAAENGTIILHHVGVVGVWDDGNG